MSPPGSPPPSSNSCSELGQGSPSSGPTLTPTHRHPKLSLLADLSVPLITVSREPARGLAQSRWQQMENDSV